MSEPIRHPGFVPFSDSTAAALRDEILARTDRAISPYLARAIDAQMAGRADRDKLERTFESHGVPAEAVDHVDWEAGAYVCALAELLTDLMHVAVKRNIAFNSALRIAENQHQAQHHALIRFLALQAPPESPPPASSNFVIEEG